MRLSIILRLADLLPCLPQGLPQSIQLLFPSPIIPHRVLLTFQGGFVGTRCTVHLQSSEGDAWEKLTQIYPEDVNRAQDFDLQEVATHAVQGIKLVFEESSDFFGRITVYDLNIEGVVVEEQ